METPRGYNPIGESAPGAPRHDAGLPGHVPGSLQNLGGANQAPLPIATGSIIPAWMLPWLARATFLVATYLTAPLQAALYPLAGIAAATLAALGFLLGRSLGTLDTARGWAWNGCFLGLLAAMRLETNFEQAHPAFIKTRQAFRLLLTFLVMTFYELRDRQPLSHALVIAAVFAAIVHFVLRVRLFRFYWHYLQTESWVRARDNQP